MLPQDQGDRLLWVLGGAVAVVAVVAIGLLMWPTQESSRRIEPAAAAPVVAELAPTPVTVARVNDAGDSRLDRAELALDAGMLIEPEGFSAWSLYADVLATNPEHEGAAAGLAAVADALVARARLAASEGRSEEAEALIERVLERFPTHTEALEIRARARVVEPEPAPRPPAPLRPRVATPAPVVALDPQPRGEPAINLALVRNNQIIEIYPRFTRALAAGMLVAPPGESAESLVERMREIDPIHPMTRDAEQQLFDTFIARYETAFDALDTATALEWLAAADRMSVDGFRVANERQAIVDFISARAASELIPASHLEITNYVSPSYPIMAQRRGVDGWVDIEFVLGADGLPRDITATDASHSMFTAEAIKAVEQWRFEPHTLEGRVVEQRAQTRIRFVIE